jgi:hypothetical protein
LSTSSISKMASSDLTARRLRAEDGLTKIFWIFTVLLGLLQFWIGRHMMNTDGISYSDMGEAISHGHWKAAINGYWNPLYPAALGLGRLVFRPSPYWEFTVSHLMNFVILLGAAGSFQFLITGLLEYSHRTSKESSGAGEALSDRVLLSLGYSIFLFGMLALINLGTVSPDLLVAVSVTLAAGIVVRMKMGAARKRDFARLGIVLGFGYVTKAVLVPLGMAFFVSAILAVWRLPIPGNVQNSVKRKVSYWIKPLAVGVVGFLLVAGPLMLAISAMKGRPTFGDSAKLNLAWYVDHVPRYHWHGIPPLGYPLHPTTKIFDSPGTFAFDRPGAFATYDIWFDPSYWDDGVKPRIIAKYEKTQLMNFAKFFIHLIFVQQSGLLIAFAVLLVIGRQGIGIFKSLWIYREELLPCVVILALYAPVYIESRYIAPLVVIAWVVAFFAIRISGEGWNKRFSGWAGGLGAAFMLIATVVGVIQTNGAFHPQTVFAWKSPHPQFDVAESLHENGVAAGDFVAWIRPAAPQHGEPSRERYDWARLAHVRIIAEIPGVDEQRFWNSSTEIQSEVVQALKSTRAKVLISTQPPASTSQLPWQPLGATGYYMLSLQPKSFQQ